MKKTCLNILGLFSLLYGLSWLILFSAVVLMLCRPNPSTGMVEAIMVMIMGAFCYIAVYFVLRGIVRLFGYGHPAVPVPQDAVLIRRVILEEVIPHGSGPPEHRVVLEEVAPYYERYGHAR